MNPIRMVDLHTQYLQIKEEMDAAIQEVIDSTAFIKGYAVNHFKAELQHYLDVKHVIPCANGTDALQLALMALDLKPGEEVITSTFTFISTVEVIALMNLKPVILDVDPDTFLLRPEDIEKAATPKTKAVIPVHLFGQCSDMEKINQLAAGSQWHVIEDAAQSLGADFMYSNHQKKKAGTMGEMGCTSFFPSKNLGCYGDGGAVFTRDDEKAEYLAALANHGMKRKYHYDVIGMNSRLDTMQAAILNVKLKYLDHYNKARQFAAGYYDKHLSGIPALRLPARVSNSTHIFHQYTIRLVDGQRDQLKEYLSDKGIPSMIYYPVPLHLQKAYQYLGYREGDLPVSELISQQVLSLPMHTELDEAQLDYIVTTIKEFFN